MSNRRVLGACPVCGSADACNRPSLCQLRYFPGQGPLTGASSVGSMKSSSGLWKSSLLPGEYQGRYERILGISYPTVRSRLGSVIEALGYVVQGPGQG